MIKYIWKSTLADHMQEYLVLKRMAGFKYKGQGRMMETFDQYYYDTGFNGDRLNVELVDGFCYGVYYEKTSTRYEKEKLLSGLAEYLCTIGYLSYICLRKSAPQKHQYTPYIYSEKELGKFFQAADEYP